MTTIAWDGRTLAADSQATAGGAVCTLREQKIFCQDKNDTWLINGEAVLAIGYSGDCGAEFEVQDLMRSGLTYASKFNPECDFGALAVVGEGRAWIVCKDTGKTHASISPQSDAYAMGSGGMIARAAMRCGKNAIDAVKIAIEMDVQSGGIVQSYTATENKQD